MSEEYRTLMDHEDGILLQDWITANPPEDDLIWKEGAKDQWFFVRDQLPRLFNQFYDIETRRKPDDCIRVVGTHRSKSVLLPVYSLKVSEVEIRLRHNFYNWVLSVRAQGYVDDTINLILSPGQRKEQVKLIYAEGFTEDWIFPPFINRGLGRDHPTEFSITLSNNFYPLYTTLYLLTESLGLHTGWYEDPDE